MKILVIGSGLSAYGACRALITDKSQSEITVLDVGLKSPYPGQPNQQIFNAAPVNGHFYPYGLNDDRWCVRLDSRRICSSHAFGGFSSVYSGSLMAPSPEDLVDWPMASKPSCNDYDSIAKSLEVIHKNDELDAAFPQPGHFAQFEYKPRRNATFSGFSRVAFNQNLQLDSPFNSRLEFEAWANKGLIIYQPNSYVHSLQSFNGKVRVNYFCQNNFENYAVFDAVFVGAGCINTTGIIDRSVYTEGTREYNLCSAPILIQMHLKLLNSPFFNPHRNPVLARNSELSAVFCEHYLNSAFSWSHTQLSFLNKTARSQISKRLPDFLYKILSHFFGRLIFSITVFHSNLGPKSKVLSSAISPNDGSDHKKYQLKILESSWTPPIKVVRSINFSILSQFRKLFLIPLPLTRSVADMMRGNTLGGWHYGGTLPMSDSPTLPHSVHADGSVNALRNVFVIDSSGFPTIPGSSVAFLTMANAHRIAKQFLEQGIRRF